MKTATTATVNTSMKDLFNGLQRSDAEKKKIIDTNRTVIYPTATKTFCCNNFNSNKIKLEQGKLMVERMKKTHMDKTIRRHSVTQPDLMKGPN